MKIQHQRGIYSKSILYIILAAFAAGFGLWAAQNLFNKPQLESATAMQTVRLFPQVREIPDFALQSADGKLINKTTLNKHWTVVFLGFTHCPDICPTTLAELSKAQKLWEALPSETRPRVLFVSVDPERDTLKAIAEYAAFFHKDTLTAMERRIEQSEKLLLQRLDQSDNSNAAYWGQHDDALARNKPAVPLRSL